MNHCIANLDHMLGHHTGVPYVTYREGNESMNLSSNLSRIPEPSISPRRFFTASSFGMEKSLTILKGRFSLNVILICQLRCCYQLYEKIPSSVIVM